MKNLAHRLSAIERRMPRRRAVEDIFDARRAWPIRFGRYSSENATLLNRIAAWREVHFPRSYIPPNEILDLWDWFACLTLEAGVGEYGGKIGLPPTPTVEQAEAIQLIEELCAAANKYEAETADAMPVPAW